MTCTRVHGSRRSPGGGVSLLLLGLALAACQVRPLEAQEAAKAVRAASGRFDRAERLANPDSIRAIMWEDAVLQPANGRRIEGHEAIVGYLAPPSRGNAADAKPSESPAPAPAAPARDTTPPSSPSGLVISAAGDMAVEWGPGQRRMQRGMYYYSFMTIWARRGGEWKVLVNSWNKRPAHKTTPSADTTGRSN